MNIRRKVITLGVMLAILVGVVPDVSAASAQDFYFQSFEADYYLTKAEDGTSRLKVHEKLTAVFPETDQNHGITRVIPRTSDAGRNVTAASWEALQFSATRNGVSEPVAQVETTKDAFTVYLGSASTYVHGTQVYELDYEFENVILGYTGLPGTTTYDPSKISHEELYWDTNGTGWSQYFESLVARVHYDKAIQADEYAPANVNTPSCYVGSYGAANSDDCIVIKTDDGYEFSATGTLAAGENLTFDIMFEPDTFVVKQHKNYLLVLLTIVLVGGVVIVVVMALKRRAKFAEKRDFYKKSPVPPEYTPIRDLSMAEAGLLSIKGTHSPEVATLMELAVTHKIKLVKGKKKPLSGYEWEIQCVDIDDISKSQMQVLQIINGGNRPVKDEMIGVKRQSYSSRVESLAKSFKNDAKSSLTIKGYFERGAGADGDVNVANFIIAVIGAIVGVFLVAKLIGMIESLTGYVVGQEYLVGVNIVLTVSICFLPAIISVGNGYYKDRTMKGLKKVIELDGLRLYMKMAEAERMEFLQSVEGADTTAQGVVRLYEKLLPYAVLFGLEDSWLAELQKYYEMPEVENPDWYLGAGLFSVNDLNRFNSMAKSAVTSGTVNVSSSSGGWSSGSSGGGGGGFSGGGGGGGGGGGW